MHNAHQWGMGIRGAREAMVHWRPCVEDLAKIGAIPALVVVYVDMANMFGRIEWDAMRECLDAAEYPEIAAWTVAPRATWCHIVSIW